MKKNLLAGLSLAFMLAAGSMTASAAATGAQITTTDGLMSLTLPGEGWYQIVSEEDAEMFSNGDCAIKVNFYENGSTLPAIESADAHHEMIYTAAASTQKYIMHVVGYVHTQDDFSAVCDAINTIRVDATKIADHMLVHETSTEGYSILSTNYTAYVTADELNVRSTSETGEIVATLAKGEAVTVTGTVMKNGSEIGWVRIKMANGAEGYVSTQFLGSDASAKKTTTTTSNASANAYRTGYSTTLTIDPDSLEGFTIYEYSDGTWRDESGAVYQRYNAGEWQCLDSGVDDVRYYVLDASYYSVDTSDVYYIGYEGGSPFAVYASGVNRYVDDAGNAYYPVSEGIWTDVSGITMFQEGYNGSTGLVDYGNESSEVWVSNENGESYCISAGDSFQGTWYDVDTGKAFYPYEAYGSWTDDDGVLYNM